VNAATPSQLYECTTHFIAHRSCLQLLTGFNEVSTLLVESSVKQQLTSLSSSFHDDIKRLIIDRIHRARAATTTSTTAASPDEEASHKTNAQALRTYIMTNANEDDINTLQTLLLHVCSPSHLSACSCSLMSYDCHSVV
jgi:hypothetical protein